MIKLSSFLALLSGLSSISFLQETLELHEQNILCAVFYKIPPVHNKYQMPLLVKYWININIGVQSLLKMFILIREMRIKVCFGLTIFRRTQFSL